MSHVDLMRPTASARALFGGREPLLPRAAGTLRKVVETIFTWSERARMRRRLLTLDDRLLRDIGITRADVHGEAEKPFWRV